MEKSRQIPPGCYDEVRKHLQELRDAGVIRESNSSSCHNLVFVKKKDGTFSACQDCGPTNMCQKLSHQEDKYSYSIPKIETLIDYLNGATVFASLDLFSGYHYELHFLLALYDFLNG